MTDTPSPASDLHIAEHHLFTALGKRLLLHVPTSAFYEVNETAVDLLERLKAGAADPLREVARRHGRRAADQALAQLVERRFVSSTPVSPPRPPDWDRGITSIDLTLASGCNLGCRYCYGEFGSRHRLMSIETAKRAVDFLIRESGVHDGLRIILFGGEPLLNPRLVEFVPGYAHEQAARYGKEIALGLATNGTLVTEETVRLVQEHHIDFQVSLDGPAEIHDRYRVKPTGEGTYRQIADALRSAIAGPIPSRFSARGTIAHPVPDLRAVVDHLLELGFGGVLLSPVHGEGEWGLTPEDWANLIGQLDGLAADYLGRIRDGRFFYFPLFASVSLTRDPDRQRFWSCGAGKNYVCIDTEGDIYFCHTWEGDPAYRMGSVFGEFDRTWQERVLNLPVDEKPGCRGCWARYLCGGGCWVVCTAEGGGLEQAPCQGRCDFVRRNVELCMALRASLAPADIQAIERHFTLADPCVESAS
jgi:uncharacterized protein